ncbi:hypothetical protein B566_EDAN012423, partial [Ephemera danica]
MEIDSSLSAKQIRGPPCLLHLSRSPRSKSHIVEEARGGPETQAQIHIYFHSFLDLHKVGNKPLRSTMLRKCVVLAWVLLQAILSKTCVRLIFFNNNESTPPDPGWNRIVETNDTSTPLEATIEANKGDRKLCISIAYLGQGNLTLVSDVGTIATVIIPPNNENWTTFRYVFTLDRGKRYKLSIHPSFNEIVFTCKKGHFGANCDMKCSDIDGLSDCKSVIACNSTSCSCLPGYHGVNCSQECGPIMYGVLCQDDCGKCNEGKECFHANGSCPGNVCAAGYSGEVCKT